MEIIKDSVKGLKHSYQVSVTPEIIEMRVKDRILEMGKKAKVPGFRPGKIPLQVLQTRYESSARSEVLRSIIDEHYKKLLANKNLRPAQQPQITVDQYDVNQALHCTFEFEVLPEIHSIDLKKAVKLDHHVADIDDQLIEKTLERVAQNNKTTMPLKKERAAKMGDTLIIDFDGRTADGPISGGSGKGIQLELGSNYFIPGFEEKLVGCQKGEAKTIDVQFPKDYNAKDLKGKKATFDVVVHDIHETIIPTMDDEFAKKIGFKDLAELSNIIKTQLENENKRMSFMIAKKDILDTLNKEKIDLPQSLVDTEIHHMDPEHKHHSHDHGDEHGHEKGHDGDHQTDQPIKKSDAKEAKELYALAERRVRLGLILADIGNRNAIEVTQKELQTAIMEQARRYPGQEKNVIDYFHKNPQAINSLKAPIFEDKVIEFIMSQGTVNEKKISQTELEKLFHALNNE